MPGELRSEGKREPNGGGGSFAAELEVARAAAASAAALMRARAGAEQVHEKARADLVTEVDQAAEREIIRIIRKTFPDDAIIAEESAVEGDQAGRRWIIDPIDGTANYVHRHPFACVSIALADDDGVAVGIVHAPELGEVYVATRGGGAFLNDQPIRVSEVADGEATLIGTGFPFRAGKGNPEAYFTLISRAVRSSHGVRRAGSAALDLAYVAAGRLDIFFEIGLGSWDIAAGMLLVMEAGGHVSGWPGDTASPLTSGRVLASNGHVHDWAENLLSDFVQAL